MRKELVIVIIISIIATLSKLFHVYSHNDYDVINSQEIDCKSYYKAVASLTRLMETHSIDDIMDKMNTLCKKYIKYRSIMCNDDVLAYMRFMMELIDEYDIENMKCFVSSSYENELYKWISINGIILEKAFD